MEEPTTPTPTAETPVIEKRAPGVVERDNGNIEDFSGRRYTRHRDGSLRRAV